MYKDKFIRLNEPIEASESLIQHTVQAAEHRAARKHFHAWHLAGAMAAVLFLAVTVLFFTQPAPADTIASSGGMPESTGNFLPLSSARVSTAASRDVDGMNLRLLTSMTDGERSYILFELQGEKVRGDMELEMLLAANGGERAIHLTPSAFDSVTDTATFLAIYYNEWTTYGDIMQQDGAVNATFYRRMLNDKPLILSAGDQVSLTLSKYTYKYQGAVEWLPDWSTLDFSWYPLSNINPEKGYLQALYETEPLHVICEGFEIVGAGFDQGQFNFLTRYHYDPTDARAATDPDYVMQNYLSVEYLSELLGSRFPASTPVQASRVQHLHDEANHCYYVGVHYPLSAEDMAGLGLYAQASWQYAPEDHEDWSLTFTLGGTQTTAPAQSAIQPNPNDLTLAVSDVRLEGEKKFSFVLSVTGDRVDPLTSIDLEHNQPLASFPSIHFDPLEKLEGQSEHERRYRIRIELWEHATLDDLGDALDMAVSYYTSDNRTQMYTPEIDWAGFDYTLEKNESLIPLGDGIEIAAIGFAEDGRLTVRLRWPFSASAETAVGAWLSRTDGASGEPTYQYMREGRQYTEGDYECYDYTFNLTREELDGWQLEIYVWLVGEFINGNWPFTVDLSSLQAE